MPANRMDVGKNDRATGDGAAGVCGGFVVTTTLGTATFDTADIGNDKTVTVTDLILTGADAVNYALTSTTATTTASILSPLPAGTIDLRATLSDDSRTRLDWQFRQLRVQHRALQHLEGTREMAVAAAAELAAQLHQLRSHLAKSKPD